MKVLTALREATPSHGALAPWQHNSNYWSVVAIRLRMLS